MIDSIWNIAHPYTSLRLPRAPVSTPQATNEASHVERSEGPAPVGSERNLVSPAATTPSSGPEPHEAAAPDAVVEAYDRYAPALGRLPGVTDVAADPAGLCIQTRSKRDAKFLDALLEDQIQGVPVRFEETGPPVEPKPRTRPAHPRKKTPRPQGEKPAHPPLSPAERVLRRYSKALRSLPHVTDASAEAGTGVVGAGPSARPASQEQPSIEGGAIKVRVDGPEAVPYLEDLIEDQVNGVLVSFQSN